MRALASSLWGSGRSRCCLRVTGVRGHCVSPATSPKWLCSPIGKLAPAQVRAQSSRASETLASVAQLVSSCAYVSEVPSSSPGAGKLKGKVTVKQHDYPCNIGAVTHFQLAIGVIAKLG